MAENIDNQNLDNQDLDNNQDNQDKEPKSYTKEELDALLEKARKEGETNGYVKGKTDTNAKWEKKSAEQTRLAKEEAEKQARFEKMSELEKAQTEANESKAKLQALEDKIALNEQKEETRKLMKDKGLPDVFLDSVLVFKDAEATLAKIVEVKELFDAEVQKAVEARITTHVPKQNQQISDGGLTLERAKQVLKLTK
jgi:hypothetical protein